MLIVCFSADWSTLDLFRKKASALRSWGQGTRPKDVSPWGSSSWTKGTFKVALVSQGLMDDGTIDFTWQKHAKAPAKSSEPLFFTFKVKSFQQPGRSPELLMSRIPRPLGPPTHRRKLSSRIKAPRSSPSPKKGILCRNVGVPKIWGIIPDLTLVNTSPLHSSALVPRALLGFHLPKDAEQHFSQKAPRMSAALLSGWVGGHLLSFWYVFIVFKCLW